MIYLYLLPNVTISFLRANTDILNKIIYFDEVVYTLKQASKILDVSVKTIRCWDKSGGIRYFRNIVVSVGYLVMGLI